VLYIDVNAIYKINCCFFK